MNNRFYITTAIEYVNGTPHLGHAYEKIGADIIARAMRLRGREVMFQMGTDEHSTNVARQARDLGVDPKIFCDGMVEKFLAVWRKLNLSFDVFIRTTEPRHAATVRELLQRIHDRGDIQLGSYEGYYCDSCERFYQQKDLAADGTTYRCPTHGIPCSWLTEQNYFFKLSAYRDRLLQHIEEHPEFIQPEIRRNEIVNVLKDGLEDISISRSGVEWGVPLPWDEKSVTYVWFDALINYVSAVGFSDDRDSFEKFWPADVQVIGKDITRFHCIYWPAMLMSAGLPLPTTIYGHGFVHFGGEKMSKTRGTSVDPIEAIDRHGADALRYYLAREISWGNDGDFTWERFAERYNADLANNLGNMVNRSLTMINRFAGGPLALPQQPESGADAVFAGTLKDEYLKAVDEFRLHDICRALISMADGVNLYIDRTQPWVVAKDAARRAELESILYNLAEAVRWVAVFTSPIMPESAEKIWAQLGMSGGAAAQNLETMTWGGFPGGISVGKPSPIFPRIE